MTDSRSWKDEHAPALFTYERLMARSIQTTGMQWQAPSLALAAQTLLLTVAFREKGERLAVTVVCLVGLLITVMAMQLMARNRYFVHLDQQDMKHLEEGLGILPIADRDVQRARHGSQKPALSGGLQSFQVWQFGFLLIALIDIGIGLRAWLPVPFVIVVMGALVGALLAAGGYRLVASSWRGFLRAAELEQPVAPPASAALRA